jgi:hypothetical protein
MTPQQTLELLKAKIKDMKSDYLECEESGYNARNERQALNHLLKINQLQTQYEDLLKIKTGGTI